MVGADVPRRARGPGGFPLVRRGMSALSPASMDAACVGVTAGSPAQRHSCNNRLLTVVKPDFVGLVKIIGHEDIEVPFAVQVAQGHGFAV